MKVMGNLMRQLMKLRIPIRMWLLKNRNAIMNRFYKKQSQELLVDIHMVNNDRRSYVDLFESITNQILTSAPQSKCSFTFSGHRWNFGRLYKRKKNLIAFVNFHRHAHTELSLYFHLMKTFFVLFLFYPDFYYSYVILLEWNVSIGDRPKVYVSKNFK